MQSERVSGSSKAQELCVLGLFALLLGYFTWYREMWSDEMQAWLIARDNHSPGSLLHILRYEGHPAIWYVLLSALVHFTWNPAVMQLLNYLFTVIEAWLIISLRKLSWMVRVFTIFSFYLFYEHGQIARSYALATLLMMAATGCMVLEQRRPKTAIALLALAINTHMLAIPVAASIALWAFCLRGASRWQDVRLRLRSRDCIAAAIVLVVSVAAAYCTVRPAPADQLVPIWSTTPHPFSFNLALAEERIWMAFLPATPSVIPQVLRARMLPEDHLSLLATVFSIAVCLLLLVSLRSVDARRFFAVGVILQTVALAITVKQPEPHHLGLLFAVFVIALIIDAYSSHTGETRYQLPVVPATVVVLCVLAFQAAAGMFASISARQHPYSDSKETVEWLKRQGLDQNPLLLDSYFGEAVVGYLERPSAYSTSCECFGSYAVWNTGYDLERMISRKSLAAARGTSGLPVVVVHAVEKLTPETLSRLGLVELHSFGQPNRRTRGSYTVYEQVTPELGHAVESSGIGSP